MRSSWGLLAALLCAGSAPLSPLIAAPLATSAAQRSGQFHRGWRGEQIVASQGFLIGRATIQIDFAAGPLDLPQSEIVAWVRASAQAVAAYYGEFPVSRALVVIEPVSGGSHDIHGTTWGGVSGFPAVTRIRMGQHVTADDLKDDWVMTHEFVHTALPDLSDDQSWLEEGLATYIEPIARAQTGRLSDARVWAEFLHEMRYGEPGVDGRGLNGNGTWARTYWGGALFCFMADVAIREQTRNRRGLQDAMRAVVAAGGGIDQDWPIERVLSVADKATGTSMLTRMYARWSVQPVPVDLPTLWQQMGIKAAENDSVYLNADAPLAAIRDAITAPERLLASAQSSP